MSMPPRDDLLARLRGVAGGALVAVVMLWSQAVPAPADDPYQLWSHGHPQEALPALLAEAQSSDRWDAWLDLGLAAAAAHDRGRAIAWLLLAHERAPERDEPREALRALGIELPDSWFTRLGPLAWPGCGWPAMLLMVVAGLAFGYACLAPARRAALALSGAGICALIAPGQFALEAELRHPRCAGADGHGCGPRCPDPLVGAGAGDPPEWQPRLSPDRRYHRRCTACGPGAVIPAGI